MATIRLIEGTTFRASFAILDEQGAAVNLTGAEFIFAAYLPTASHTGHVPAFLTKTLGSGVDVTSEADGTILLTFNPSETVDRAGVYEWELQLTEINGDIYEAGSGVLLIQPARRLDE